MSGAPRGERIVQSSDGSFSKEQKCKIAISDEGAPAIQHCIDIMLPACSYDIRIAAVCEVALPYEGGSPEGIEQQRRVKNRTSWSDPTL